MNVESVLHKIISDKKLLHEHPEFEPTINAILHNNLDNPASEVELLKTLVINYAQLCRKLESNLAEVKKQSITDCLTLLYNRAYFESRLQEEIERAERYKKSFSLIMLDIDHFKQINDTFGHPVGDKVLRKIAYIIRQTMRKADVCARWGGEEFIILAIEVEYLNACMLAERLRKAIEKTDFPDCIKVTASFGVAKYYSQENSEILLKRVDNYLYTAKRMGRNKVIFDKSPNS